ncbi:iron chelate uptake ABC transporter family permease subunit [Herbivorax sp. ANBcel31]|uniref:FecCD family ABC transporter permease n=1 Tax=Herbivorax sp. ANBcel31 TaxID=3069754 RepID=UPI0027B7F74A|nr:iron chelate uptake ABC transporter family permease subunit [Herbivorax sp. ANBcel31]MDQ2086977.1 iron chelate uptake ABC transporter family permease subunit [Herbivorax sp. ANBcel31]
MIYTRSKKIIIIVLLLLIIALLFLIVSSATFGAANISFMNSLKILLNALKTALEKIPFLEMSFLERMLALDGVDETQSFIVLNLRLPRIILSALIGASLAVTGVVLQGMFKNPMADPYVLGISSGASFGAAIAIAVGLDYTFKGLGAITIFAFLGAVITIMLVYNIAREGNKVSPITLILAGISVSFMLSSVVSLIMVFNRSKVEHIVFWVMGSISSASWNQVLVLLPIIIICIVIIIAFSRDLNVISTGEETAKSLGIEVERLKKIMIVVCSILVASCVAVSGVIGFVGLIIPHTIRLLTGSDHRIIIPFSAIGGAAFMVICDTLARSVVPPTEIPVGAITSVVGAPYFIYLLSKNKKKVYG